jgi:hypothetical protein
MSGDSWTEIKRQLQWPEITLKQAQTTLGRTLQSKAAVGLSAQAVRRHLFCLGSPGTGKTRFLSLLARLHLDAGHTLIVLDPHGTKPNSLFQLALTDAWDQRLENELIIIDPSDPHYTLAWNPTAQIGLPIATHAEYLLDAINKACGDFLNPEAKPQHERWLLNVLATLITKNQPLIKALDLLGAQSDAPEIDSDRLLQKEWQYYQQQRPARQAELTESVFNRLRRLLSAPALRAMFSQSQSVFSFSWLLQYPCIVLVNLGSSPYLSRRAGTLLGTLLLADLMMALEMRGQTEPHVAVICDEASRFITPDLAAMMAEMRGYGASLTLAAQSLSQLSGQERKLLDIALDCSETIITFRAGYEDAQRLAKQFLKYQPYKLKDEIKQTKFEPVIQEVEIVSDSETTPGGTTSRTYDDEDEELTRTVTEGQPSTTRTTNTGYITDHLPFTEVTSRTYFSPEEQLLALTQRIRDLPDRHAIFKTENTAHEFLIAPVPDAGFTPEELVLWRQARFSKLKLYSTITGDDAIPVRTDPDPNANYPDYDHD